MENEGWKLLTVGSSPEAVDWGATRVLVGHIVGKKSVTIGSRTADVLTLRCEDGTERAIWRTVGLAALFEQPVGTRVKIIHTGLKKSARTGRTFRAFSIYVDSSTQPPF